MALLPVKQIREQAERERVRLERGERPAPRLASRVQRVAVRSLAGFFVLMLAFTLISRAADGVTVARVQADSAKTGILTQRFTAGGSIEPVGDLSITLPGGIGVTKINALKGQQVQAGDVLMELDQAGLERTLEKLRGDLKIINLKLQNADLGNTAADTDAILSAQAALEDAQEDYDRLMQSRDRTELRAVEDLQLAQDGLEEALSALGRAQVKAKQELVEAAKEKVEAAEKNLKQTQEAAEEAVEAAEQALASAQDSENAANEQIHSAGDNYNRARDRYQEAYARLQILQADPEATPEEIQQAENELTSAQNDMAQAEAVLNGLDTGSAYSSVKRAKDNLEKVKSKQDVKIKEAEQELEKAQAELIKEQDREDVSEEPLVVSAQSAVDAAENTLHSARRGQEDASVATEDQLFAALRAIEAAQRTLDNAQRKAEEQRGTDEASRRQAEIERLGYQNEKRQLQQQLETLEQVASAGGLVAAPVAGTVETIMAEPGKTQEGVRVAAISRSDQGFTFEAELDQKQAEKLSIGDEGTISYTQGGKSNSLTASISAISTANEEGKVRITIALPQGSYPTGVTAEFEIASRSKQYNSVLPLSALRSDADGTYILVLREKQTVMGIEQMVERLSVTVLEQDSQQVAVEAALSRDDKVISSSSKPIAPGDRVRVSEA